MKVGFYVQRVASAPGFEDVVSAHVQLPLHTIQLLRAAGHDVHLITTEYGAHRSLPNSLPADIPLHTVAYGSRQGDEPVMYTGRKWGIRPLKLIKQLDQFKQIVDMEGFDVMHFFGSSGIAYLAGLLKTMGVRAPIILTINSGRILTKIPGSLIFWRKLSAVITSTEYLKRQLQSEGLEVEVIKHGTVRDFGHEIRNNRAKTSPQRVLFWRDPSYENGADVCLSVYQELASKYPDVSFDLAVRPHWKPVADIRKLPRDYANVHLYEFPYQNGITIEKLLTEAICVLLPFRELSTHPQFAVLESLQAGCAVVTTALDSNFEIIENKKNGYLVPVGDISATIKTVEMLLNDREHASKIGEQAAIDMASDWNWNHYISEIQQVYASVLRKQKKS